MLAAGLGTLVLGWFTHPILAGCLAVGSGASAVIFRSRLSRAMVRTLGPAGLAGVVGVAASVPLHLHRQQALREGAIDERWHDRRRQEVPRTISEMQGAIERRDWEAARESYMKVRKIDPTHPALAKVLEQIEGHTEFQNVTETELDDSRPAMASSRRTGVDPDCYADGLICDKRRVADAERADELLRPVLASSGWASCYALSYVAGDDSESAAFLVTLHGAKSVGFPDCIDDRPRHHISKSQLSIAARRIKRALASEPKLIAGADLLMVTNGWGSEVKIPLP